RRHICAPPAIPNRQLWDSARQYQRIIGATQRGDSCRPAQTNLNVVAWHELFRKWQLYRSALSDIAWLHGLAVHMHIGHSGRAGGVAWAAPGSSASSASSSKRSRVILLNRIIIMLYQERRSYDLRYCRAELPLTQARGILQRHST